MTTNILIGIGGTGAKVVESALSLVTAGLGSGETDKLHIGLMDQDRANGNVNRTATRLKNLIRFQRVWGGRSASSLDWSRSDSRIPFGSLPVAELFDDRALWCPEGDDLSLASIVGQDLSPQQQDLFDLLFMPGEQEQDLQLGEGYRGRAHVGAAALIASMLKDENELIDRLRELMESASRDGVRIFIVGSAFGGTGAAGFPTLARELDRIRRDPKFPNKEYVSVGGALMLPYFHFAKPEDESQPVVTSDELLPKARLALEYYGRLFETEKTFDRFYVVGWDPFFDLGYHEPGNYEQRNPPLLPELFAATAAVDFLGRDEEGDGRGDVPVMLSARADRGIRWSDLPLAGTEERLGQGLRFSAYWRYVVEPLLGQTAFLGGGNWTQKLRGRMKPVDHAEELDAIRYVTHDMLEWAAAMQTMSGENWAPGPWNTLRFHDRSYDGSDPRERVRLLPHPFAGAEDAFDQLVRAATGEPHPRDSDQVYEALINNAPVLAAGENEGYGKVAAAAYRAMSSDGER